MEVACSPSVNVGSHQVLQLPQSKNMHMRQSGSVPGCECEMLSLNSLALQ